MGRVTGWLIRIQINFITVKQVGTYAYPIIPGIRPENSIIRVVRCIRHDDSERPFTVIDGLLHGFNDIS